VCATAGNFGQGMAFAARKRGLRLTIFASANANPLKVERMRALGTEVRLVGENFKVAHSAAKVFAAETGAQLIEMGASPLSRRELARSGRELLRWPEPFDAILVPLGDGALLAGVARWVKAALAGHADDRHLRERRTSNGAILAGAAGSGVGGNRNDR